MSVIEFTNANEEIVILPQDRADHLIGLLAAFNTATESERTSTNDPFNDHKMLSKFGDGDKPMRFSNDLGCLQSWGYVEITGDDNGPRTISVTKKGQKALQERHAKAG